MRAPLPAGASVDLISLPHGSVDMKILWITSGYPWPGNPYGGIFFQTQAQALSRLGVTVAVEAVVPWIPAPVAWISSRHAHQRSAPRHQVEENLRIHRLSYFAHRYHHFLGWPHLLLARQILKNLPFKPDLIHGHFAYPIGLASVLAARRLGIPSVITLHGSDVNHDPTATWFGSRRFRLAVTGADHVLCVSQALREKTRALTGRTPEYLPIGVNLRRFTASSKRAQARKDLNLPADRAIILYIGNLWPFKGVQIALDALSDSSLAGALGVFVGSGPLGPAVASQANCLWRESVPNPLVPSYLAAADLLILPSYAEGLPTVLVEAGACGTPVLATRVGGIPELLQQDRGRLIEPGSAPALREAILDVLARPEVARQQAERLREHVREAFDADLNAGHLLRVYQELVSRSGAI